MADIYPKPPSILQSINQFDEWVRNVILRKADGTLDLPPGIIPDTLLSDASTDIKQRFASHLADYAMYVAQPVYNVKGYDAKGDGVTDDTAAIQAAIDAANIAGGGIVFLPKGVYLVSSTIKIASGIIFMGAGQLATEIKLASGAALGEGIICNSNYALGDTLTNTDIVIARLRINGNNITPASGLARGIFLNKVSNCRVENVTVVDTAAEGIRIDSSNSSVYSEYNAISHCKVSRVGKTGANIMLRSHTADATNSTNAPRVVRYNTVEKCISIGGDHGILCFNVAYTDISHNQCFDANMRGIIMSPTCEDMSVIGNLVLRAGTTGIHGAYDCKRIVVANNRVSSTVADGSGLGYEGQGIKFYAGFECLTIVGNVCISNATDGIALMGGREGRIFDISGNICLNNARDGIRVFAGAITLTGAQVHTGSINGNVCRSNTQSGIRIGSDNSGTNKPEFITVSGNSLLSNGQWGLLAEYLLNSNIGTNHCQLNTSGNISVSWSGLANELISRFVGPKKTSYSTAAPTTGTWEVGDIVWNISPAAAGKIGWVCVAGGTPGTWKAFGAIDA